MSTEESAEKVRRRMAELRREMECDVREVTRGARVMTDWRFYVRKFPWAAAGLALAAGYFLIPKKKPAEIKPDPEMLAELVKQQKLHIEAATRPEQASMVKTLAMMGLTWAARTGFAYITQRLTEAAAQQQAAHQETAQQASHAYQPEHEPGPSPLHEPWTPS